MMKPASSLCNMRCAYCFYADVSSAREVASFGLMPPDTRRAILKNIFSGLEPGDQLTLAFQGGEPTLAGLEFFRDLVREAGELRGGVRVDYALQTNGYLLDEAWCAFLKEHRFLVGLSLDGPAPFHDANRLDAQQEGTFRRVLAAMERMDRFQVEYNVLTVLTNRLARHPQQIWRFLEERNIQYVQFIPCLGPLEGEGGPHTLTPRRYAQFYTALFDLWYRAFQGGRYRSVKLFDDLVNLLALGQRTACGITGQCLPQIIVEADGGVYPCDFYVLDQYRAGDLRSQPLNKIFLSPVMAQFPLRPCQPPVQCGDCPYRPICNGGCKRMRREVFCAPDGTCGHRLFLDAALSRLQQVARQAGGRA